MIRTDRLDIRPPTEDDRPRMIELWQDEAFMVYSDLDIDPVTANARFDRMLEIAARVPFAKQPVVERSTGTIIGYSGVGVFEFEGEERFEFGYRLDVTARGKGYATEAGLALVDLAARSVDRPTEILAMIDPRNQPSQNVAWKLGFDFWKVAIVEGYRDMLFRQTVG